MLITGALADGYAPYSIIGSNISLLADYGTTIGEAYARFWGNSACNIGYVIGTSNSTPQDPRFVIGRLINSSNPQVDMSLSNGNMLVNGTVKADYFLGDGSLLINNVSSQWFNGASNIYFMSNVGIGTADPLATLDVNGTVKANYFIGDGSLLINNTSSQWFNSASNIYFTSNVGIGTADPLATLDVNGTVKATYFVGNGSLLTDITSSQWFNAASNIYFMSNVGIGTTDPLATLDVNGTVKANYFLGNGSLLTDIISSQWFNTANSNIYFMSNVGIGTENPQEKLHIRGNAIVTGQLITSNLVLTGLLSGSSNTGNAVIVNCDILPSACNVYNLGSSNYRFKDLYLSGKTIDLGGTQITRDDVTGGIQMTSQGVMADTTVKTLYASNIGIGTTVPLQALHVEGNIHSSSNIYATNNLIVSGAIYAGDYSDVACNLYLNPDDLQVEVAIGTIMFDFVGNSYINDTTWAKCGDVVDRMEYDSIASELGIPISQTTFTLPSPEIPFDWLVGKPAQIATPVSFHLIAKSSNVYVQNNRVAGWYNTGYNLTDVNFTTLSSFNTSTGVFTCKIAGTYSMSAQLLSSVNSTVDGWAFYKNATNWTNGTVYAGAVGYGSAGKPISLFSSIVIQLIVGDTVSIYCTNGTVLCTNTYIPSTFSGYLINGT